MAEEPTDNRGNSASPSDTAAGVTVPESQVMQFVSPLWGFVGGVHYALLPAAREGLWWLQAMDEPHTTFVLGDPFIADSSYALDLSDADRERLQVSDASEVIALVMLTLPSSVDGVVTANFRAPLVFNLVKRLALQVVSGTESYSLQQPISLAAYAPRDGAGASS